MTKNGLYKIMKRVLKTYMIPPRVKMRPNVNWTEKNSKNFTPEFFTFLFTELKKEFYSPEVEITSANDSDHSTYSTHYDDKAFDLATKDLVTKYCRYTIGSAVHQQALVNFCVGLANELENYVIIGHIFDGRNHIHFQKSRANLKNPYGANASLLKRNLFADKEALPKYNNLFIK